MRRLPMICAAMLAALCFQALASDTAFVTEILRTETRREIHIPDVDGMKVLKCDFHMHTIFSDGDVWPTVRVNEAWLHGLDAIAITDHIEGEPRKPHVGGDHNASYEIALPAAQARDILLVRGGEITRDIEGHYNAIFLNDVNPLDTPDFFDAVRAAIDQGAFVFWNHPLAYLLPGQPEWSPTQERLVSEGLIHGIEVFNEREWYPVALDWCAEKGLAVMGNSDIHDVTSEHYDLANRNRPMTLVLAKERTLESLRDAVFAGRTIAWFGDSLAGKKEHLEALAQACLTLSVKPIEGTPLSQISITNISDIPFAVQSLDPAAPGHLWIAPRGSQTVNYPGAPNGEVAIANLKTGAGEVLHTRLVPSAE
jgi:3',5'-nucleoside bisphosphate phosphatase